MCDIIDIMIYRIFGAKHLGAILLHHSTANLKGLEKYMKGSTG